MIPACPTESLTFVKHWKPTPQLARPAKGKILKEIKYVHGQGNWVLSMASGTFAGDDAGFYDLFRLEGGKIIEHWDTIQTIPPKAERKNPHGKF
jgi:predicted SnoaL-like aldol condensation-catalyzing enzyme